MDDEDDVYPMGEYPPLECFGEMIVGWVVEKTLSVLDKALQWKEQQWPFI